MLRDKVEYEQVEAVETSKLRKGLVRFNEDLGIYINNDQRYKLGRVLTIIDASISDLEQRKAVKDLIQDNWWSNQNRPVENGKMVNPHTDIRGLCKALGFELYEVDNIALAYEPEQYAIESYKRTINQE
jgi:hypothetical protein